MRLGGKVCGVTDERLLIKIDGGVDEVSMKRRMKKYGAGCEIIMLDKRSITTEQRKKAHVLIAEIADWQGYYNSTAERNEAKKNLKVAFLEEYNYTWFSLRDCSVEIAYDFIDFLVAFCMENGVPTKDLLRHRYEDLERYLYNCLKYGVCAVCGKPGLAHHIDAIGMGQNRKTKDDSMSLKISLCSKLTNDRRDDEEGSCHDIAHRIGWTEFSKRFHVKGIIFNEKVEREIDG